MFFYSTFPGPGVNVRMYKQINNMYPETNQQFTIKEKSKVEKLLLKFSLTDVVQIVHKLTGINKNRVYKWVLNFKKSKN